MAVDVARNTHDVAPSLEDGVCGGQPGEAAAHDDDFGGHGGGSIDQLWRDDMRVCWIPDFRC